jgi:hypothetical protein
MKTSVRLSDSSEQILTTLCDKLGASSSRVVEIALRQMAVRENFLVVGGEIFHIGANADDFPVRDDEKELLEQPFTM